MSMPCTYYNATACSNLIKRTFTLVMCVQLLASAFLHPVRFILFPSPTLYSRLQRCCFPNCPRSHQLRTAPPLPSTTDHHRLRRVQPSTITWDECATVLNDAIDGHVANNGGFDRNKQVILPIATEARMARALSTSEPLSSVFLEYMLPNATTGNDLLVVLLMYPTLFLWPSVRPFTYVVCLQSLPWASS